MNAQTLPPSRFGFLTPLEEPPSLQDMVELETRIGKLEQTISELRRENVKKAKAADAPQGQPKARLVDLGRRAFD